MIIIPTAIDIRINMAIDKETVKVVVLPFLQHWDAASNSAIPEDPRMPSSPSARISSRLVLQSWSEGGSMCNTAAPRSWQAIAEPTQDAHVEGGLGIWKELR